MAVLKILEWPAPALSTKAKPVEIFDEALQTFVADLIETMDSENGIGLAANQVGSLSRVFVSRVGYTSWDEENGVEQKWWHGEKFVFVNPKIIGRRGKMRAMEGCLSFPDIFDYVDRASEVTIEAFDETGKRFEHTFDGLMSVCVQHELDHLDGIVFVDRMSRLKSGLIKTKMRKRAAHEQQPTS